uniref:Uncharacterized protein n=1 Tax=Aegilops tauschii TaxID=37682 RepID=M8C8H4_AEGTA
MALRTVASRTRSAALHLAAPAPRFSPPAKGFSTPAAPRAVFSKTAARYYSAGALVIDEETVQALVTGVAKCNSVASKCLAEILTVQDLQIITLVVILSGVVGAWYVGQQVIDRGSEILGQLQKHAPEILGSVCDEMAARQEMDRLRLEEFNRAQEEKKREAAQMYEQSLARKQINDQLLKDKLREERIRQLTGQ